MYQYQKTNRYFAQVAEDIKDISQQELQSLGAKDIQPSYRGLFFNADKKTLYKINFHSRLINRIFAPLITFACHSDRYLYKTASQIAWNDFIDPANTLAVSATVTNSIIRHSKFAALRLKDAVVDYFRNTQQKRPSIDRRQPDLWLNLYIENNEATISVDTSGGSLHRRGYRQKSVLAPMMETVAASILQYAQWEGTIPLYDPFCGSGTILCEAFMMAAHIPASINREKFGFEILPDFDTVLWQKVRSEGLDKIIQVKKGLIGGSDISQESVLIAKENCLKIDKNKLIILKQKDVFDLPSIKNSIIVCNPPYGFRLEKKTDLTIFYKRFGDFLKQRCTGSTAYIYFGERKYIKNIRLKSAWKKPLNNGGLDGRLVRYDLY